MTRRVPRRSTPRNCCRAYENCGLRRCVRRRTGYAVRDVSAIFKRLAGALWMVVALLPSTAAHAQIKAQLPSGPMTPPWDKGIQPISRESYWNAIECGKQGGARPLCVFYDADLCKNDDFVLTFFTPYKFVAYNVWDAVRHKQAPPTPDYGAAQRTRITLGVTPAKGSKNPIAGVSIRRGDHVVKPATQSVDTNGGQFIFSGVPTRPREWRSAGPESGSSRPPLSRRCPGGQ